MRLNDAKHGSLANISKDGPDKSVTRENIVNQSSASYRDKTSYKLRYIPNRPPLEASSETKDQLLQKLPENLMVSQTSFNNFYNPFKDRFGKLIDNPEQTNQVNRRKLQQLFSQLNKRVENKGKEEYIKKIMSVGLKQYVDSSVDKQKILSGLHQIDAATNDSQAKVMSDDKLANQQSPVSTFRRQASMMKTLKNKDQSNTELIKQQKLKAEYKNNKQLEKQAEIQMEKHKRTANMKLEVIRKASASIDLDLNTPTNRNPTLASLNTP